jgi:hypothetical protein
MPSDFLKRRHAAFIEEEAGAEPVEYFVFDGTAADSRFGFIDNADAYETVGVKLPALIIHQPSNAMREKLGLDIRFNAVIEITKIHADAVGLDPKTGDMIKVPPDNSDYEVKKVAPGMQAEDGTFINYLLAVEHRIGRR